MGSLNIKLVLAGLGVLLIVYLITPFLNWLISLSTSRDRTGAPIPPTISYKLPLLKSTIPFLFDGLGFFAHAS